MELKQSLENVQKWIKANPKKAGLIAVVLIVLAWLVIRRAGSGGGGGSGAQDESASIGGGSIDLSGMGGSASDMPAVSGGLTGSLGGGSSGGSSGGGDSVPVPSVDLGGYDPGEFESAAVPAGISDYDPTPAFFGGGVPATSASVLNPGAKLTAVASGGVKSSIAQAGKKAQAETSAATISRSASSGVKSAATISRSASSGVKSAATISRSASSGVKSAAATISRPTQTTTPPPVMVAIKETLKITPAKVAASAGTGTKSGAVNTKIATKTATAPALYGWYKTPWAARLWLPVAFAQARGYIKVN